LSSHTLCLYGFGWHVAFGRNIARIENLQSLKIQKNANFRADTSTHQVSPANVSQLKCKCSQTKFVFTPIYSNYIRISIYMYIYILSLIHTPYIPISSIAIHFFVPPKLQKKKPSEGRTLARSKATTFWKFAWQCVKTWQYPWIVHIKIAGLIAGCEYLNNPLKMVWK
jgi:hypothetical protein